MPKKPKTHQKIPQTSSRHEISQLGLVEPLRYILYIYIRYYLYILNNCVEFPNICIAALYGVSVPIKFTQKNRTGIFKVSKYIHI